MKRKVKPFKGRFVSRKNANRINDALLSAKQPDRTELAKEAKEFIDFIKNRRAVNG